MFSYVLLSGLMHGTATQAVLLAGMRGSSLLVGGKWRSVGRLGIA